MKDLRQLKPQDVIFIGGELSNVYQHTGGLILLDASDSPDFCFEKYRQFTEERIAKIPPFTGDCTRFPLESTSPIG